MALAASMIVSAATASSRADGLGHAVAADRREHQRGLTG
jgi:hypothetical protein